MKKFILAVLLLIPFITYGQNELIRRREFNDSLTSVKNMIGITPAGAENSSLLDSIASHNTRINSDKQLTVDSIASHNLRINTARQIDADSTSSHNTRINTLSQKLNDSLAVHRTAINNLSNIGGPDPHSITTFGVAEGATAVQNTNFMSTAIEALGGVGTLVVPKGAYSLNDITFPVGITLEFEGGGMLATMTGKTITIEGKIVAPVTQIFTGSGTVNLKFAKISTAYAAWFGVASSASGYVNSVALDKLFLSKARSITFTDSGYTFIEQSTATIDGSMALMSDVGSRLYFTNTTSSSDYYAPNANLTFTGGELVLKNIRFAFNNTGIEPWGGDNNGSLLSGVMVVGATRLTVDKCTFNSAIYAGLQIINSNNVNITNTQFNNSNFGGLLIRGSKHVLVDHCEASYNESRGTAYGNPYIFGYGMSVSGRFPYPKNVGAVIDNEDVTFSNNTCLYNGRNGIDAHGAIGLKIINNYIYGYGGRGIYAVSEGGETNYEKPIANVLISGNYIGQDNSWFTASHGYNTVSGGYEMTGIMAGAFAYDVSLPIVRSYGSLEISNNIIDTINTSMGKFGILVFCPRYGARINYVKITNNVIPYVNASYAVITVGSDSAYLPTAVDISNNTLNGTSAAGGAIFIKDDWRAESNSINITNNTIRGTYFLDPIHSEDSSKTFSFGNTFNGVSYVDIWYPPEVKDVVASNINLKANVIQEYKTASDEAGVYINYHGYNNDTTYYRDFSIFNGKERRLVHVYGKEGIVEADANLDVIGNVHPQAYMSQDNSLGITTKQNGVEYKSGLITGFFGTNIDSTNIIEGDTLVFYIKNSQYKIPRVQGSPFTPPAEGGLQHTYFINLTGNDANDGKSSSTPWATISKVNSTTFAPGDTILFSANQTWTQKLEIGQSGTEALPIVIGKYGVGNNPTFDGGGSMNSMIACTSKSYQRYYDLNTVNASGSANGNINLYQCNNIVIERCTFNVAGHGGVFVERTRNSAILYNTITTVSNSAAETDGVYMQFSGFNTIAYNNITISNSGTSHNDGIQCYADTTIEIYKNKVIHTDLKTANSQGIYVTVGYGTYYIYNNVIDCRNNWSAFGFDNDPAGYNGSAVLYLYENTIIAKAVAVKIPSDCQAFIRNNIFYLTSKAEFMVYADVNSGYAGFHLIAGSVIDYNSYYCPVGGWSQKITWADGVSGMTWAQWRAYASSAYDQHSYVSDPLLSLTTYQPDQSSITINSGYNLGTPYSSDIVNQSRPVDAAYDMGAYEYGTPLSDNVDPTNHYVDLYAAGTGTGASWTNAATSISALNWATIDAGDSIFVSGGVDSVSYPHDSVYNKYRSSPVVICTGKEAGHNGKVIYLADKTYSSAFAFGILNSHNIKVTGFTFKWLIDNAHKYTSTVYVYGSGNCTVDNSHIINDGHGMALMVNTDTNTVISNNYVEYLSNSYMDNTAQNDQDGMNCQNGAGGHTIIGNTFVLRGLVGGSWHIDGMQWYNEGSTANLLTTISNNFIYYNARTATGTNAGIYINSSNKSNRFLISNNILSLSTSGMDGMQLAKGSNNLSVQLYNNTIMMGGEASAALILGGLDTLVMKNNIFVNDSSTSKEIIQVNPSDVTVFESNYNRWYARIRGFDNWNGSAGQDWTTWQGLGLDANSTVGDITFSPRFGIAASDYNTADANAVNKGTTVSAVPTAYDGTSRPQGSAYDIGAYER